MFSSTAGAKPETADRAQVKVESGEAALERRFDLADEQRPGWDMESQTALAIEDLESGVSHALVRRTYGERVFSAACEQINAQPRVYAAT
jgi:hypothetical protein